MKLNLGCGARKLDGYVNVDRFPAAEPDVVWDLERTPWPFDDDSVSGVIMSHVLEHLGALPDTFVGVMKELYRVCRAGAQINIVVPHPRTDLYLCDPTHVRPVQPAMLALFSKEKNRQGIAEGLPNTPLGLYHDIDFRMVSSDFHLMPRWGERIRRGEITQVELLEAVESHWNVVEEIHITLEVVKP